MGPNWDQKLGSKIGTKNLGPKIGINKTNNAREWHPVLRFTRLTAENRSNHQEPPAYFPVEPGKTGAFQPEPQR